MVTRLIHGNRVPLYRQIAQTLRRRVRTGVYSAGSPLPAVRALCAEFGVGTNAVQKAIYELEQEKIVVTHHGRGTRVMQEAPCDQAAILFGLIEPYERAMDFESRIVRTAEKVFSGRNDFLITRSSEGDAKQERAVAEHFVRNGIKGIMVWPVENDPNGPFFAELAKTIPVVVIDRALAECDLPCVTFDFEQAGYDAGRQLLGAPACRGLLAVMDDLDIPPYRDFEAGLARAAAALGRERDLTLRRIPSSTICQQVDQGNYALVDVYQKKFDTWLKSGRYDALFCFHDDVVDHVLMETGLAARFPDVQLGTVTAAATNNRSRAFNQRSIQRWLLDLPRLIQVAADQLQTWVYARAQPAPVPPIRLALLSPSRIPANPKTKGG